MGFDMEVVGLDIDWEWKWDFKRTRTLIETPTAPNRIKVRITTDSNSVPSGGDRLIARWTGPGGKSVQLSNGGFSDYRPLFNWMYRTPENSERSRTWYIDVDREEILSQYDRGGYSGPRPGAGELSVSLYGASASTDLFVDIPSNAKVRENTSISNIELGVDGRQVTPTASFKTRAGHGVNLPVAVEASIGDRTIYSTQTEVRTITGASGRFGTNTDTLALPSFTIPSRTFTDSTLTYTITPTEWADGWVDPRDTTVEVGGISVEDVSITDCAIAPQQVTVPEEVTLTATVSNPTPGRVDADVRFVLAGEETFTKQPVGGDSERTFETTYATSEPGEATGEVFLDDVVPL